MQIRKVIDIAQSMEIPVQGMTKKELIQAIQKKEGNTECFKTGEASKCGQDNCLWISDCN